MKKSTEKYRKILCNCITRPNPDHRLVRNSHILIIAQVDPQQDYSIYPLTGAEMTSLGGHFFYHTKCMQKIEN